jgi:hypothetical protein
MKPVLFVEDLNTATFLFNVLPCLLKAGLRGARAGKRLFYIDGSWPGVIAARLAAVIDGAAPERLEFRQVDIRDEAGRMMRLRIAYQDLAEIQKDILNNPVFQNVLKNKNIINRMPTYLAKNAISISRFKGNDIFRAQFLVHVAVCKLKSLGISEGESVLFLRRRFWAREIKGYAWRNNVKVVFVRKAGIDLKSFVLGMPGAKLFLKKLYFGLVKPRMRSSSDRGSLKEGKKIAGPSLAVEYYGHLNLDRPEMHSDLFFWQQSALRGEDLSITFGLIHDPLDESKKKEIDRHGMSVGVLHPDASTLADVPVYLPPAQKNKINAPELTGSKAEKKWMRSQLRDYNYLYHYWREYFRQNNIKMYISWFKYNSAHCVIADALQSLGGVTAIYQRAFEEFPSVETTTDADIVFGFSPENAKIERLSNSVIPYYVSAGYFGDHRFGLLKRPAQELRQKLHRNGAKHIIAFFDENSGPDPRWHTDHEFMRDNYRFLLEKLLSEPWLGLVFKPKVPATLRKRLGDVAELLVKAEATGRCSIFEGGVLHGSYPPAIAALSSDITIHGHLCAATAGVEAALAGVPTLLMDREGWPTSRLYELGRGKIVFNRWQDAWDACVEHWKSSNGIPGFGDWGIILDRIDPFRDGRAAERIGTYLKWILDGFKAGLPRETVLADAAERYCKIWGKDKVTKVQ